MTDTQIIVAQAQASVAAKRQTRERIMPLWLGLVIGFLVVFNGLPFLAPVFMKVGWEGAGRAIYVVYTMFCHQMAQRSFFLFGPDGFQMHNIAELPVNLAGLNSAERMLALRAFLGNEALGWKVAWSDRMVYMYVTPLLASIGYAFLRRKREVKPLPLWAFGLLLLPMALDGGTHWLSDLTGSIGGGFRYTNVWLATLTGHAFSKSFYMGDTFGSFNSWMRLLSGVTFGLAIIGLAFPYIDEAATGSPPEPDPVPAS